MTFLSRSAAAGAVAGIAILAAPAQATGTAAAGLQAMRELNLIVLGNMTAQGGEVEGKAFVGGNVNGNSFQVGFGSHANGNQGLAQSARSTWTVGGSQNANINLNNGNNGSSGKIGDFGAINVYGASVAGNVQSVQLNSTGGTVRVGGNIQNNLNIGAGTTMYVTGSMNNGANLSDNVVLGIGGNAGQIQGGQNTNVSVTGNVQNLGVGGGATAQVGGTLNQLSGTNNQNIAVFGNIGQANTGSGSTIKAGGSIGNINGSNGVSVYAGGSINGNTNGGTFNPGFTWNGTIFAPVVPLAPAAPDVASQTTQLTADLVALSSALSALSIVNNPSSITLSNNNQRATFNAVDSGAGYALFNVTASIFDAQEFSYNFPLTTLPVIINVTGSTSYTMRSNFINQAERYNQQVIWNFGGATSITFDREQNGSVLAPLAAVTARLMEGTVVAASYTMQDEIHLGAYAAGSSFLPAPSPPPPPVGGVPEPASWAMLIAGFGLVGAAMRRRKPKIA